MFESIVRSLFGDVFYSAFSFMLFFYPIWLPLLLAVVFWKLWVTYVRRLFFLNKKPILLEIRLPREVTKSPASIEQFFNTLYQTGQEATFIDRYWKGQVRAWFSCELVSLGGFVHLYIWTDSAFKNHIETQLYAQIPGIEVYEVPDYALSWKFDPEKNDLWGCEMKLDKADAFPIKTYIDYGLEKDPKEELEVNPMASVLEFLGSLKPLEQFWVQIVITANTKKRVGGIFGKEVKWRDEVVDEIHKLVQKSRFNPKPKEEGNDPNFLTLSKGQQDLVAAMERTMSKLAFNTGIRVVYAAPKEAFNKIAIPGFLGAWKQFNSEFGNGFKPSNTVDFNYPWQDFNKIRANGNKRSILNAYKRRQFFYTPHVRPTYVLTTEELATIFHFPGSTVKTPTLPRVPSTKAQPPANLPV